MYNKKVNIVFKICFRNVCLCVCTASQGKIYVSLRIISKRFENYCIIHTSPSDKSKLWLLFSFMRKSKLRKERWIVYDLLGITCKNWDPPRIVKWYLLCFQNVHLSYQAYKSIYLINYVLAMCWYVCMCVYL